MTEDDRLRTGAPAAREGDGIAATAEVDAAQAAAAEAAKVAHEADVAAFAKVIGQHHDDMARVAFVVSGEA